MVDPLRFVDQDFFEADPVRYGAALGDEGVSAYREAIQAAKHPQSFAVRYARERLAVLDRDTDAIIRPLGGDLTGAHQFLRVAEAMAELGLDDEVLTWTTRGIQQTTGHQIGGLYDLACRVQTDHGRPLEVLRLRRQQHEHAPTLSTYTTLRSAEHDQVVAPVLWSFLLTTSSGNRQT